MICVTNFNKNLSYLSLSQLAATLAASVLFYFYSNSFISAFLGGIVCIVPAYLFAKVFFNAKKSNASDPKKVLANFYLAEFAKFITTFVLFFAVLLMIKKINAVAFFITFVFVQITNWALGFMILRGAIAE